jgi:chromate reductase
MVIFSLSGSLRENSSNTSILHTIKSVAPAGHEFIIYDNLGNLPHFNPDLDNDDAPEAVKELRGMINRSSAIIISTPEYAHGIPGSLKNALDWLVSTTVLENKPISIIMGSSGNAEFAQQSLIEVLKTMNGKVVPDLIKTISGVQAKANSPETWQQLKDLAENLILNTRMTS